MPRPLMVEVKKEAKTVLIEFGENTTAHGVPRITKARTLWARVFWVVVCLLCTLFFLYQASVLIKRYARFETTTQIEVRIVPYQVTGILLVGVIFFSELSFL